jgi:hypothetical protein
MDKLKGNHQVALTRVAMLELELNKTKEALLIAHETIGGLLKGFEKPKKIKVDQSQLDEVILNILELILRGGKTEGRKAVYVN